tara:strand:+ start:721 stop:1581 length:861 start_codon:yes stop_codon:yes gene_type:complete
MKTTLLSFFALILSTTSYSQLRISVGGFYSSPLEQFCVDDYSDGYGADLGLALVRDIDSTWSIEAGVDWQYGINGKKRAELSFGDYDLKNTFVNWQLKLNLVRRIGRLSPYAGFHVGGGKYYTTEYLAFNEPQEDQVNYYDDVLYRTSQFHYGAQLGTYVHVNEFVDLNIGVSFNKSDSKVKYIDFESYTFDGTEIDYQEKTSAPFLILIHAGISIKLHPVFNNTSSNHYSNYDNDSGSSWTESSPSRNCSSSSSSSSSGSSSTQHYEKKQAPTLIKNGKTPVGFK